MDELIKINRKVKCKQVGRFIGILVSYYAFVRFLYSYAEQNGITQFQKYIHNEFPDLYDEMTDRICKAFEK
jgi:hypothetical protein